MTIHLLCAADARYAMPLTVTLHSLAKNMRPGVDAEVYVLDDGLSDDDKSRVAASIPPRVRLHWRRPATSVTGLPTWGRMSATTYHKLTLGEWAPGTVERALWLDCDLLVLDDVTRLWESRMDGHLLLAAQDERVPLVSSRFGVAGWRQLGLPSCAQHFNAGVLLIDMTRWRAEEVGRRAMEYVRTFAEAICFWDQEALNAVLAGQWMAIDPRWNWHPGLALLSRSRSTDEPRIVHFSGNHKPWDFAGRSHYRSLYLRYMLETAWRDRRLRRTWTDSLLEWYESSAPRRLLYPSEQWVAMAVRALTKTRKLET